MINNVSQATKSAIARKSAQSLPHNPSEKGYSAEEIKRRLYQPIIDAANSAIAEIDRVVNEANISFNEIRCDLDNFINSADIKEPYKIDLDNNSWVKNNSTEMYEIFISANQHQIADYKDIGVDMFLLDGDGNYTQVNQFEIGLDGTVRCFHETNGAGYLNIYSKREGLVAGKTSVEAENIKGLAKVAITNDFNDLDNAPDLELAKRNELAIAEIISGVKQVKSASHADEAASATTATYAQTSGSATNAINATKAAKATQDAEGNNIVNTYAKQNGTYADMTVGKANNANNDKNGADIVNTYAKQNGTYADMTVGNLIGKINNIDIKDILEDNATSYIAKEATLAANYKMGGEIDKALNTQRQLLDEQNRTINQMHNGTITVFKAEYARGYADSGDIANKFTDIDRRLTELGFKSGAFNVSGVSTDCVITNEIKKQGKYVIATLEISSEELLSNFEVSVPAEFRPKQDTKVLLTNITEGLGSISEEIIYTNGTLKYLNKDATQILSWNTIYMLNIGWETN